jgi:alanine racemase
MIMKNRTKGLRTWIEIDKKSVLNNLKSFRGLVGDGVKIMSVVKSNAYGHGLWDFSNTIMKDKNLDWFGVDSVVEGLTLRKEGVKKPILVLGYVLPEMLKIAQENDLSIAVSSMETIKEILRTKFRGKLKIHLKLDTGMHRHGFNRFQKTEVLSALRGVLSKVEIEGIFTHFASAKDPSDRNYTNGQIREFTEWVNFLSKELNIHPIRHASATGGSLIYENARFDMIRVGIGMYGLWPSEESKKYKSRTIKISPVLSWKTIVAEIKMIKKGEGVGYDLSERVNKDTKIAILPIGYWHGFPRGLSRVGCVYIGGVACKVLGNVCMDIIMVDVSMVPGIRVGDEVEIIGRSDKSKNSLLNMAKLANMSIYELVTRINPLIKRIVI